MLGGTKPPKTKPAEVVPAAPDVLFSGDGVQTSSFVTGGYPPLTATEEYNGSSWTGGGAMGTSRYTFAANGSQSAGLAFGGYNPGTATATVNAEEYNGSSWAEQNNIPTATSQNISVGTQVQEQTIQML